MTSARYRLTFIVLALVLGAFAVVQVLRGSYATALFPALLALLLVLRAIGVIPAGGLASRVLTDGLTACPRCGKRLLAPADDSGIRPRPGGASVPE